MPRKSDRKKGGRLSRGRVVHPFELKQRAVKLYLEEGYPVELVAEELGVGHSTLNAWAHRYREQGEDALRPRTGRRGRRQASTAAKQKAIELKRQNPACGTQRISALLRRMFLLRAGAETVRRTLHEQRLIEKPQTKPKKKPAKPRFFERTTPNQLWQADIFSFRLGGKAAYLIGYVDDYSRYVTGLDLFRSQTAEHVREVYRQAVADYGVPKEMLTDNGRQYTNWRGKTRFESELSKERIQHIKSRPHQNYKRPHQGIGGLCPADRFFEIQAQLRKVPEQGVAENVLEQALRGKPQAPFYLVGRMGEQSVVMRAEKGKVRLLLDGQGVGDSKELVYKMEGGHGSQGGSGGAAVGAQEAARALGIRRSGIC